MTSGVAALATWVVTAGFGSSLFITWLARGGVTQHPPRRRLTVRLPPPYFPALLVFSHLLLAAGGLVIWVSYLMTDSAVLAWIALFVLLPVAVFGFSMFARWLGSRRLRVAAVSRDKVLAESRLPTILVLCHGVFGATTIALVLLTTIGVGGS